LEGEVPCHSKDMPEGLWLVENPCQSRDTLPRDFSLWVAHTRAEENE